MLQDTLPARSASAPGPTAGAYKVDISRGTRIGRVSSEWFSRPDDERHLYLSALHAAVRGRSDAPMLERSTPPICGFRPAATMPNT